MKIKFVIHPGIITSKSDRDEHYIGYRRLIQLYKLDPRECINYGRGHGIPKEAIHLYPKYNGEY